jgi:abortive infection bacteriophage resistance protein
MQICESFAKFKKILTKLKKTHILTLTEPNTPLNDADHVGSFNFRRKCMGGLKQHQDPMTIEEQIKNLKKIGLIVADEEYAKKILNDISYFRLIKAYSLGFKEKNSNYNSDVTFEQIVELYLFNANFRQITFAQIEKIEINCRCRISNYVAETYGVLGYTDSNNFVDSEYHKTFLEDIEEEIVRNSKAPFVRNFRENYEGGQLPIYALVEVFSFGTLSKFFKNMKNPDKKAVAKTFGIGYTYLESWLESISYVRNICAHYGRLYNAKLSKTPLLYKEYSEAGIGNNRMFGILLCMKHILKNDSHWNLYVQDIETLIDKYEKVDIKTMGFPKNWKEMLLL